MDLRLIHFRTSSFSQPLISLSRGEPWFLYLGRGCEWYKMILENQTIKEQIFKKNEFIIFSRIICFIFFIISCLNFRILSVKSCLYLSNSNKKWMKSSSALTILSKMQHSWSRERFRFLIQLTKERGLMSLMSFSVERAPWSILLDQ